ncbi:MAG: ABC-2 family transporter protein [Chloroflexota bacterium]
MKSIRNAVKLIGVFLKVNLQIALAYRADTVVNILLNLMWLGWELLGLSIIFSNTDTLAGWGPGELIALLGVFRLVNMLMAAVIWPATEKFNTSVRDGSLDYTLLQPANSLFIISLSRIVIWRIWDLVLAVVLIVVGIQTGGGVVHFWNFIYFLVLVASGALVIYSLWVVLIALTFWFVKFDNNVTILQALMDSGRYPATVYPPWLRLIVTYLVPIAVATTIPLQGLRGELGGLQVLLFVGVGLVAFVLASQVWKAGLRQYSGASS